MPKGVNRPAGYQGLMEQLVGELGIDLAAALERGDISASTVEHMMSRCTLCAREWPCAGWLDSQAGHIETPPHYCLNAKLLAVLKDIPPPESKS